MERSFFAAASAGAAVVFATDVLPTPVGPLLVVCSSNALCALDFGAFEPRLQRLLTRRYGAYQTVQTSNPLGVTARLRAYLAGDRGALDGLPVDPGGTPYQRRVWQALCAIPYGQTRTYGQLAAVVGGTHARAIGQANSLNPVAIVIPCHRVIGADASLTGYAGGLARKRWLLDLEARREALLPWT